MKRLLSLLFFSSFVGAACSHVPAPVSGGVNIDDAGVQTCITWANKTDAGLVRVIQISDDGGAP